MKLDFIIGGGVASGTSFLSSTLMKHQDLYLSKIQRPEPNFFHYTWKFEKGIQWYQDTYFSDYANQKLIGDRSSLLLTSALAPKRIKSLFPDTKLIFCLRNPIERAWANYRFTVLEGLEPLSFSDALDNEDQRIKDASGIWAEVQPHAYTARSKYSTCLKEYLELFGKDKILLIKSEELSAKPVEHISMVCNFLGINPEFGNDFPVNYTSPSVIDRGVQVNLRGIFGNRFSELVEVIRKNENFSKFDLSIDDKLHLEKLKNNLSTGKEPLLENDRFKLNELLKEELIELKRLVNFSIEDWR